MCSLRPKAAGKPRPFPTPALYTLLSLSRDSAFGFWADVSTVHGVRWRVPMKSDTWRGTPAEPLFSRADAFSAVAWASYPPNRRKCLGGAFSRVWAKTKKERLQTWGRSVRYASFIIGRL